MDFVEEMEVDMDMMVLEDIHIDSMKMKKWIKELGGCRGVTGVVFENEQLSAPCPVSHSDSASSSKSKD
ncbi:hypothetical protein OIU84_019652 [Salix udensis]|uniref:Uncharacterized protein n=1 Tax=Salix udensis TaxID=889485 RepID=A0AAD6KZJ4_9ROSI|nr:hypothetical protein OIU84_019652 [Salix udensis]